MRPGEPPVDLAAYRGRPVVLNFWASWCAPCVREMPALEAVHRRLGDAVAFVGIDGNDSRRLALRLMEKTGVTYPSGYDPTDAVHRRFRLVGRPNTVLITARGRVATVHVGELTEPELLASIRRHLGAS